MRNSVSERREIAWRKWQRRKEAYASSLGGNVSPKAKGTEIDLIIFEGDIKYRDQLKEGKLPPILQTGEKMINSREQPFYAPPINDPVYKFLTDVEKHIGKTASKIYDQMHSSTPTDDEGKETFIDGKRRALEHMIRYFESRGTINGSWGDNKNSLRVDSEKKYRYLLSFVDEKGLFNQRILERFVRELPSYSWEKFSWP